VEKYTDQLHCYAFALENPDRGRPYSPVKRLGLFMFAPEILTIGENEDGQFRGKLKFQEIPRNDGAFFSRMEKVAAVLAGARPEPAEGCKFCGYRQSAVKELEIAQQNERFWAAARIAGKHGLKQPLTTMVPIRGSSCLLSAGWQEGLALQFRNGNAVYFYPNAPQSVYEHLMAAESKGRFVNDYIVGRFATERLS
jgi:KTSC domain